MNVDGWGWTKATNLKGDFHGEALSRLDAAYLSQDPAHKTVGNPKTSIRTKGTTYPATKPAATIPKGTIIKVTTTGLRRDHRAGLCPRRHRPRLDQEVESHGRC